MEEKEYISICKKLIEEKYNLSELIERDFEFLHEVILEKTKTDLSTSTLRRIWSNKYQSIPQSKTLEALAQLLGYSGWHDFKQVQRSEHSPTFRFNTRYVAYILGLGLIATLIISLTSTDEVVSDAILNPEVSIHEGVPATIGFHYDIKDPNVEIELSWNPYERTKLDVNEKFYTGTYFYPDYHKAKLLNGDQVLTTSTIHVTTKSWHCLIMDEGYDPRPSYLDSTEYMFEDKLSIGKERLIGVKEKSGMAIPVFTLSNEDLSKLSVDNLSLHTKVESHTLSEDQACSFYEILIKGEKGNIRLPISQTGCYGLTSIVISDRLVSGKQNDLSALSTDLSRAHELKVQIKEKKMLIDLADNPTLTVDYENSIGSLKVIKFMFQGSAEITAFELLDGQEARFESKSLVPF